MKISRIVKRFMVSYLFVLIIPLITGIFVYQITYNLAVDKSIKAGNVALSQSKEILDRQLLEVDRFTRLLARNENLNLLLNNMTNDVELRLLEMNKLAQDLSVFSLSNNILSNIFIYLEDRDIIITPGSTYFRTSHFYEENQYTGISHEQWKQYLKSGTQKILPYHEIVTAKDKYNAITVLYPIPHNTVNKVKGLAVIIIDENRLLQTFKSITEEYGGWAYIVDSENNLLAHSGIDERTLVRGSFIDNKDALTNEDDLIITAQTSVHKWTIVAGLPKQNVLAEAYKIKNITIITVIITLIVGSLICLFLSYKDFAPISRILKHLNVNNSLGNSYKNVLSALEGNFLNLINTNGLLKKEVERQQPLLTSSILYKILMGDFRTEKEIEEVLQNAGIYFLGNKKTGYVTILSINHYSPVENIGEIANRQSLRKIIKGFIVERNMPFHLVDIRDNKIAMIHISENSESVNHQKYHEHYLKDIHSYIVNSFNVQVFYGIGETFTNYIDINHSYRGAEDALRYAQLVRQPNEIFHYKKSIDDEKIYFYPLEVEIRIVNALKKGQYEEISPLIDQIFANNCKNNRLAPEVVHLFLQEVKATFLKELYPNMYTYPSIKPEIQYLYSIKLEDGLTFIKNSLKDISKKYCELVVKNKNKHNDTIVEDIINYIEKNYYDQNMGVAAICDYAKLPEKTISPLFKENTGQYLSEYLENYRLNQAEKLLMTTEKTIEKIAYLSGYNSAHSFRRAFKRVKGISPNQYRKYMKQQIKESINEALP